MIKFKNPVNYTLSKVRMSKIYKSNKKTKNNGKNKNYNGKKNNSKVIQG